jgi:U3 small nucleolar RNA-associated protein 5
MSTKRKFPTKLGQPAIKPSAKVLTKDNLDDSRAIVGSGIASDQAAVNGTAETIEISSDSEEEEDEEEEAEEEQTPAQQANEDIDMDDAEAQQAQQDSEEQDDNGELTFGDLVLAHAPEPIDVAAYSKPDTALTYKKPGKLQTPTGASLGTVLTQALTTNDIQLLESCLHTADHLIIRSTISRLSSPLASSLLSKLAERLHRRPGRAKSLMVWVQWTLVTHGGYLATQPDLIAKLAELDRVVRGRARGLQSLLGLKGKLDLLEAQMQARHGAKTARNRDEEADEAGVVYVEGEEEEEEDSEDEGMVNGTRSVKVNGRFHDADSDDESDEDMPNVINGAVVGEDDSQGSEDESDDDENLIDDEAEETDDDEDDEDEVDHSDVDELEEDEESDDAAANATPRVAPPSKLRKVHTPFSSRLR